ncbi:hypothetical protein E3E36_00215 [Thermococcus sp. M36]|uniref:hypothetical protein n=1 Tax=Thermococcus sp. M36 TaxID=1638261 RepID=UPI001439A041|nr:hypothetical protein [Thermococcus sp. M36]NJE04596.1 hypothetical protein [Thermococcus sp. M36]
MKKLVVILFGLLVVAAGFAAATIWQTTVVRSYKVGDYGWALAEVGVKYDVSQPYTNYEIIYKYGNGGLTPNAEEIRKYTGVPYARVEKKESSNGITVTTTVYVTGLVVVDKVIASAGWPNT